MWFKDGGDMMKRDVMQRVIKFILKYIWIFCFLLIVLEFFTTLYISKDLMLQTTNGVMQSVSGEISGRVDGVLRLLIGLSTDKQVSDTSKPMFDRVMLTKPYKNSYNLFMIALTDKNVHVVSSNESTPPKEPTSLAYRDYMQRLYSTGTYQITNAFPAGSNNVTMNYTIAVPIIKNDQVEGSVFGSIYFTDIEEILKRNSPDKNRQFYLLGSDNTFMSGGDKELYGKGIKDLEKKFTVIGTTTKEINEAIKAGKEKGFWEWGSSGLSYVTMNRVEPTPWILTYRVLFYSVLISLLPVFFIKISFYIALCITVSLFGRRYLRKQLDAISHLLDRVTIMQKELFQTEHTDYDTILDMTEKGLSDQLTGLFTRTVFLNRVQQYMGNEHSFGAVFFIDLDNLKTLNDIYSHEAGDLALIHFAKILKQYSGKYTCVSSRYGGDEFILLLNGVMNHEIPKISDELCTALSTNIYPNGVEVAIHGSIGVSLYPQDGNTIEELISKADFALYDAKKSGKNMWVCYNDNMAT